MSVGTKRAVIDELKRIASLNDGVLRPEDVVAEARDESSPLHSAFEWDENKAAHEYRLWQARQLIRVTVTYLQNAGDNVRMRVFVSLSSDRGVEGGGYRATADVLSSAALRRQLIEDALAELETFKAKYKGLEELAEVFAALSRAEKNLLRELGYLQKSA